MKIVFHDLDGCLNANAFTPIPISGEPLPPKQIAKLRELGRKLDASSIDHVVINTGRSIEDTLPTVEGIASDKLQFVIAEHGALYRDLRNEEFIVPQGPIVGKLVLIRNFIDWYRETGASMLNERVGADIPILDKVANLTLDCRNGLNTEQVCELLQAVVRSDAPFEYEQLVFHHSKADGFVDAMSQINKADGVQVVTSLLAQTDSSAKTLSSIAIGNGLNDLPMLKVVNMPVCPGNAEPEVRHYCHTHSGFVSEYNYIDATLHWLEEYV